MLFRNRTDNLNRIEIVVLEITRLVHLSLPDISFESKSAYQVWDEKRPSSTTLFGLYLPEKKPPDVRNSVDLGGTSKRIVGHDLDTETTADRDEFRLNSSVDRIVDG
jgi:hypothetical protein